MPRRYKFVYTHKTSRIIKPLDVVSESFLSLQKSTSTILSPSIPNIINLFRRLFCRAWPYDAKKDAFKQASHPKP